MVLWRVRRKMYCIVVEINMDKATEKYIRVLATLYVSI